MLAKKWRTERYHAPSDDINQPIELAAAARFNQVLMALAEAVANRDSRPEWRRESFFKRFATH